jgi:hypothetical protein
MSQKKYVLHPGYVRSADGDEHFISSAMLADLYKLKLKECIFANNFDWDRGLTQEYLDGLIHLNPDPTGKYELPSDAVEGK